MTQQLFNPVALNTILSIIKTLVSKGMMPAGGNIIKARITFYTLLAVCIATCATAQTHFLSDGLNRLNSEVDVAFDPLSGNALVVWCQRTIDSVDDGAILASYILKHPTGELEIGDPFRVSPDGGNHQRPRVQYLNASNGFLIVWDSSLSNLSAFNGTLEMQTSICSVYARIFFPPGVGGASEVLGNLTDVVTLSPEDDPRCFARPRLVLMPSADEEIQSSDDMLVFGVVAGDSEEQPYAAWAVSLGIDSTGNMATGEVVELIDSPAWAVDGGFVHDGLLYAVGSGGDEEGNLHTGLFMLDAELLTVEASTLLASVDADAALLGSGSILPLDEPNDSGVFRLVAIPAGDPAVFAIDNDFSESSMREFDRIGRDKSEVISEELFSLVGEEDLEETDYVLYASADGAISYRKLKDTTGKPRGAAKTVDSGEESLLDVSISLDGSRGYIGFSRMINKRKSAVYIVPIQ